MFVTANTQLINRQHPNPMATFKSLEDLAALKKDMKREKEAKAKQTISAIASRINRSSSPHRHEESNVCVYSTTTYNAIDKNVLKKLKESQASKGNSSSTAENASATKQDKKAREKLRRKVERKGLSKNAIKSQLRPCLTWNEDEQGRRDIANSKLLSMSREERMELLVAKINFGRKKKQGYSSTGVPLPSDEAMREYVEKKRQRRENYYKNNSKADRTPRGKFYINVCMGGQNKKY